MLDKGVIIGEEAFTVKNAQAKAVGQIVALFATAASMIVFHGHTSIGANNLSDRTVCLSHGVYSHTLVFHGLERLQYLGSGAGLG